MSRSSFPPARSPTSSTGGCAPRLYGSGRNVRDWIHVDDHNSAVWTIIDKGEIGQTYLIGGADGGETDNRTVVETILELCGRDPPADFDFVTDRPGHDLRYAIDSTRLRTELGWSALRLPQRGRDRRVYRSHEDWWRPLKAATERAYARTETILEH